MSQPRRWYWRQTFTVQPPYGDRPLQLLGYLGLAKYWSPPTYVTHCIQVAKNAVFITIFSTLFSHGLYLRIQPIAHHNAITMGIGVPILQQTFVGRRSNKNFKKSPHQTIWGGDIPSTPSSLQLYNNCADAVNSMYGLKYTIKSAVLGRSTLHCMHADRCRLNER